MKLKNKIFINMCILSITSIVVVALVCMIVMHHNIEEPIEQGNRTIGNYLAFFLGKYGIDSIEEIKISDDNRITIVKTDGTVYWDSKLKDTSGMENHLEREEIKEALENGEGEAKRISKTLSHTSYYYALKINDDFILRVSTDSDMVMRIMKSVVTIMGTLALMMIIIAMSISKYSTRNIVKPLNSVDFNNYDKVKIYDELEPFISKIRSQNEVINEQVKKLKRKQLEFTTLTENMSEGLIVIGKKGKVISYNNSATKLLETDLDKEITDIYMFCDSPKFEKVVSGALSGKKSYGKLVFGEKICQLIANPIIDNKKVKGTVVLVIDETEKERRETLRREFSANVSHELKTPLTSISGYAELIKSGMVKDEDIERFASVIYTEARRLITLVEDIIKISKLDDEDTQLEKEKIDVYALSNDIRYRLESIAVAKNIKINISRDEKAEYTITTVRQIVDEIIYNIVENAIKYNKDGGYVNIILKKNDDKISVVVEDSGIGISTEDQDRVFERFYRVDKSHSKEVGGTGLGLSIVKHGAQYIGAKISMESEVGWGTKVKIEF